MLSPEEFPEMLNYIGQDLIVTDGTTLLGADDKAGIAEIVTAVAYLQEHPEIKHGKIRIAFNPDEEIGRALINLMWSASVRSLHTLWMAELSASLSMRISTRRGAKVTIKGRNVHPGTAKHKMVNSIRVATQFIVMLPRWETPEHTEGYEGFIILSELKGA